MILFSLIQRLFSLISIAILALAVWLIWSWADAADDIRDVFPNAEVDHTRLYWGLALLAFSLLGRVPLVMLMGKGGETLKRRLARDPARKISISDGSELAVEVTGPAGAPMLIFTHGWGLDSTMWRDAKDQLSQRYQVVTWDLPGLGRSRGPKDGTYTLPRFAAALREVLRLANGPAILVGHSIGGMTVQTFCRQYPETMGREVAGVVLENTTHINPLRTTALDGLLSALRWPLIEPLMRLEIWLSPLVWLMNWQSYLSGSSQLAARIAGFGSRPTRAQLNQTALLAARNSPKVQAKGNLAMFRWGVTEDLPAMTAPALVFIGGRDLLTRPLAGETIARMMPNARPYRVPDAGHMGPMECADDYNEELAAFADQVFTRGAQWADAGAKAASVVELRPRQERRSGRDDQDTPPIR